MFRINLRLLAVTALAVSAIGCSDDVNNHYSYPAGTQTQSMHDYISLPAGVSLDGVNAINFYSSLEGLIIQSEDTSAMVANAGAFNGGGVGNKAYVGLRQFGGVLTSEIKKIEFEARLDRGTSFTFLNLQVDCDGDGTWVAGTDAVVVIDSNVAPSPSLTFELDGTFKRFVINSTDPVFKSVGAVCGLPLHTDHSGLALSALPATAKLFNGITTDGGMPRATSMPAILFLMNDSSARVSRQVTLRELKVNDNSFKFYQNN